MNRASAASPFVSAMKPCPVPRCPQRIATELVCCRRHWALVPPVLKQEIFKHGAGRGPAYQAAAAAAIEAVSLKATDDD